MYKLEEDSHRRNNMPFKRGGELVRSRDQLRLRMGCESDVNNSYVVITNGCVKFDIHRVK